MLTFECFRFKTRLRAAVKLDLAGAAGRRLGRLGGGVCRFRVRLLWLCRLPGVLFLRKQVLRGFAQRLLHCRVCGGQRLRRKSERPSGLLAKARQPHLPVQRLLCDINKALLGNLKMNRFLITENHRVRDWQEGIALTSGEVS